MTASKVSPRSKDLLFAPSRCVNTRSGPSSVAGGSPPRSPDEAPKFWLHLQTSAFSDARQPIVQPMTPRTLSPDVEHFAPSPPATPPISPRSLSPDVEHFGQSTSCSMKAPASEGRQPTVPPITPRTLSPDVERFAQGLNQQRGSLACVDVPADSLSSTGSRMGRCNTALSKPESKPCGFFMLFTH